VLLTVSPCKGEFTIHLDQSIFPFFHSYNSPIVRSIRNASIIDVFIFDMGSIGKASTSVISTSKIKNSRATKKNWNENGIRGGDIILNPHSNCLHLFFLVFSFLCTIFTAVSINVVIVIIIIVITVIFIFHFSF